VVLAIAALTLAAVAPRLGGSLDVIEAHGAARELAAAMRHARSEAVRSGRETVLELDLVTRGYRVPRARLDGRIPEAIALQMDTARSEQRGRVGRIRFFPDGSATGGRISLAHGVRAYAVEVDWLTGRVETRELANE